MVYRVLEFSIILYTLFVYHFETDSSIIMVQPVVKIWEKTIVVAVVTGKVPYRNLHKKVVPRSVFNGAFRMSG